MSAVNLSGTFKKDVRPDNGLEAISDQLAKDELGRTTTIIGVVELRKVTKEPGEEAIPTVRFVALEPVSGDAEATCHQLLNAARQARGRAPLSGTLFDAEAPDTDADGPQS